MAPETKALVDSLIANFAAQIRRRERPSQEVAAEFEQTFPAVSLLIQRLDDVAKQEISEHISISAENFRDRPDASCFSIALRHPGEPNVSIGIQFSGTQISIVPVGTAAPVGGEEAVLKGITTFLSAKIRSLTNKVAA